MSVSYWLGVPFIMLFVRRIPRERIKGQFCCRHNPPRLECRLILRLRETWVVLLKFNLLFDEGGSGVVLDCALWSQRQLYVRTERLVPSQWMYLQSVLMHNFLRRE